MFGSKPKQPKTPDPKEVSQAQTESNQQTAAYNAALNRGNTTTPFGTQTFTQRTDPVTGAPVWDQEIKLSPEQQQLYDQQQQQNLQIGNASDSLIDQIKTMYGAPMDTSGAPQLQGAPTMGGYQSQLNTNGLPSLQGSYASGFNTSALPQLQSQINVNGPDLQGQIDMNGMPELYGASDLETARKETEQALYGRSASYLDPQWQARENEFRTRMAGQGVVEGSEAWRTALDDQNRARSFDYDQARMSAVTGSGQEMQRLSDIARSNRGAIYNERSTGAQFTNNARAQAMAEAMAGGQFNNDARAQGFAEQATMDDANLRAAGFTNAARSQGFGEATQAGDFYNAATGAANADALRAAGFNNTARDQYMNELYRARAQPLTELMNLRNTTATEIPEFGQPPSTSIAPTNVADNIWNAYNGQMDAYNAAQGGQNALWGSLANLGGQLGSAWIQRSDRRLKKDIEEVGELPTGVKVYDYTMRDTGERQRGVMAQDVEKIDPEAVYMGRDGYRRVNYSRVMAAAIAA